MTIPAVRFTRLRPGATPPRYATDGAAGADLSFAPEDGAPLTLAPGARALAGTGLAIALPPGIEAQVRPRSGLALRQGVTVLNAPGTIDADYRGEVGVLLINLGDSPVTLSPGDRIAQLVVAPAPQAAFTEAASLNATDRGAGGFGSTGTGSGETPPC